VRSVSREVQVGQLEREFAAFADESAEWAELSWGAALETWPDFEDGKPES
jgi:hypothetical protein